jgi:hypothetical protein
VFSLQNLLFAIFGFFFYIGGGGLLIDRHNEALYDSSHADIVSLKKRALAAGSLMVLQSLLMLVEAVFETIGCFRNKA